MKKETWGRPPAGPIDVVSFLARLAPSSSRSNRFLTRGNCVAGARPDGHAVRSQSVHRSAGSAKAASGLTGISRSEREGGKIEPGERGSCMLQMRRVRNYWMNKYRVSGCHFVYRPIKHFSGIPYKHASRGVLIMPPPVSGQLPTHSGNARQAICGRVSERASERQGLNWAMVSRVVNIASGCELGRGKIGIRLAGAADESPAKYPQTGKNAKGGLHQSSCCLVAS